MTLPHNYPYKIFLGSSSPRRKDLLEKMGFKFDVIVPNTDESYPNTIDIEDVPEFIAEKKSLAIDLRGLPENFLVITADTVVVIEKQLLGKPKDREQAVRMLYALSGQTHKVITGVCLRSINKECKFSVLSEVTFRVLSLEEIEYYVDAYKPFDKAGAYGLQEWIGYVALERLEGSFFNVMGLPTQRLYRALVDF